MSCRQLWDFFALLFIYILLVGVPIEIGEAAVCRVLCLVCSLLEMPPHTVGLHAATVPRCPPADAQPAPRLRGCCPADTAGGPPLRRALARTLPAATALHHCCRCSACCCPVPAAGYYDQACDYFNFSSDSAVDDLAPNQSGATPDGLFVWLTSCSNVFFIVSLFVANRRTEPVLNAAWLGRRMR